jgi:hypothetical protein
MSSCTHVTIDELRRDLEAAYQDFRVKSTAVLLAREDMRAAQLRYAALLNTVRAEEEIERSLHAY